MYLKPGLTITTSCLIVYRTVGPLPVCESTDALEVPPYASISVKCVVELELSFLQHRHSTNMPSSPSSDLVPVTCASGKEASALLPLLSARYSRLRLAVNSPSSQQRLQAVYPNAEVVRADLNFQPDVHDLFRGVTTVYYVGPSVHHHETQCGYFAIDAALAERNKSDGNFKHFIFSSVLNTQLRKLLNHDCKRYVEERLYESSLDYTVLKPCNFLAFPIETMVNEEEPVFHALRDPSVSNSLIALEDLAEVSLKIIDEREKHFFAEYPFASMTPVPYTAIVEAGERALDKKIKIETGSIEQGGRMLAGSLYGKEVNPKSLDAGERLVLWYNRYGLNGNSNVMRVLLGRDPMTLDQWM